MSTKQYANLSFSIENMLYLFNVKGRNFNIRVTQTFDLIKNSTGVCVKNNCKLEYKDDIGPVEPIRPLPTISNICDTFITASRERVTAKIDRNFVESLRLACLVDLDLTLDPIV
jgi:hypothetical protein